MSNKFKTLIITIEDAAILRRIQDLMTQVDAEFTKLSEETKAQTLGFHNEDDSLNHCIRWGLTAIDELCDDLALPAAPPVFGYYINQDQGGNFLAVVRDIDHHTVFDIKIIDGKDEAGIFDEGNMSSKTDISGLTTYLRDIGVIPSDGAVLSKSDFEREQESRS